MEWEKISVYLLCVVCCCIYTMWFSVLGVNVDVCLAEGWNFIQIDCDDEFFFTRIAFLCSTE